MDSAVHRPMRNPIRTIFHGNYKYRLTAYGNMFRLSIYSIIPGGSGSILYDKKRILEYLKEHLPEEKFREVEKFYFEVL